jgi:group I intron endonuclease
MIGIYCITNNINGKKYIGQSVNIKNRWQQEKHLSGINKHLESAFQKYGLENFSFEVLEECQEKELNAKEVDYIKKFNSTNREMGYNQTTGGEHFKVINKTPMSEETRRKISESKKGQKFSETHKNNLSKSWKKENHVSPEISKKISESSKGRKMSISTRRKISESNKGKKRTAEQNLNNSLRRKGKTYEELFGEEMAKKLKKEQSERLSGKTLEEVWGEEKARMAKEKMSLNSKKRKIKCSNGEIYNSIKEAAEKTKNISSNIVAVCKGRQKTSRGLIYEYV